MGTDIPIAITNLRLKGAFRGFAVNVMDCITSSDTNPSYVVDDDIAKYSRFASANEIVDGGFTAHNPSGKTLYLLSIDNRLISNAPGGVADCAVFCIDLLLSSRQMQKGVQRKVLTTHTIVR